MEKNQNEKEKDLKKLTINNTNGLHINYEKIELEKQFPNLISEITDKKKTLKIHSVNPDIESITREKQFNETVDYYEDLKNPGAIDFLRRCTSKNEAIEILDYLQKRKEISQETYKKLKLQILKKGGLKNLIEKCGGFKNPGYYERKFYEKKV